MWIPLAGAERPGAAGATGDVPLEGLLSVPTRAGAVRLVAVPHVAQGLALGDELAVVRRGDMLLARGELALALSGTVRVVLAAEAEASWRDVGQLLRAATGDAGECWLDLVSERAVAASVPRGALATVFEALGARAALGELQWEYATPARHLGT